MDPLAVLDYSHAYVHNPSDPYRNVTMFCENDVGSETLTETILVAKALSDLMIDSNVYAIPVFDPMNFSVSGAGGEIGVSANIDFGDGSADVRYLEPFENFTTEKIYLNDGVYNVSLLAVSTAEKTVYLPQLVYAQHRVQYLKITNQPEGVYPNEIQYDFGVDTNGVFYPGLVNCTAIHADGSETFHYIGDLDASYSGIGMFKHPDPVLYGTEQATVVSDWLTKTCTPEVKQRLQLNVNTYTARPVCWHEWISWQLL